MAYGGITCSTMRTPITGEPVSGPFMQASLNPFWMAGMNSGGMFEPTQWFSNSAAVDGFSSGSMYL